MTPSEAFIVLSAIAIGTYLTNTLFTLLINVFTDLNSRLLCSEPSTKPSTPLSSTLLHIYNLLTRFTSRHNLSLSSKISTLTSTSATSHGYLSSLPQRKQRQQISRLPPPWSDEKTKQQPTTTTILTFSDLRTLITTLTETYPDHVYLGHSSFSSSSAGGNISLCSRSSPSHHRHASYHGEIAHVHPNGSIHIILHPTDTSLALFTGWAHHPQAAGSSNYCSISPPSNPSDLDVIKSLLKASIWYARGKGGDGDLREEESILSLPALLHYEL